MNNKVEHVSLAIQDDFLAHQTRALPISALAELIWNSLDSEAGSINVEFQRDDLAGGLFGSGGAGLDGPQSETGDLRAGRSALRRDHGDRPALPGTIHLRTVRLDAAEESKRPLRTFRPAATRR